MRHYKIPIFLFPTVYIGLLFLCQVACQSNSNTDDITQEACSAPDTPASETRRHPRKKGKEAPSRNTTPLQPAANTLVRQPEEAGNRDTNASASVAHVPVSMHHATPATNPEQVDHPSEVQAPPSSNAAPSQPTVNQFTLKLRETTRRDGVRNFVLVTITPSSRGMALKDFFVTTSLSDSGGTARGSSGKGQNGFVYKALHRASLAAIFLTNVNCLGAQDTSFAEGKEITFKIEAKPSASVSPGAPYLLTVTVESQGSHPHTTTQGIEFTAPAPSPRKTKRGNTPKKNENPHKQQ